MLHFCKTKKQRICRNIIITILVLITASFATTKIVYDSVFQRYEPPVAVESGMLPNPTESFHISMDDYTLFGQLFQAPDSDTLIIIAPGFHAGIADYAPQITSFLEEGLSVFAFDTTGCGKSGGDSQVGFPQIVQDLERVLDFVEENNTFGLSRVVLFGHSRGGYGVCCALEDRPDIAAAVCISGSNSAMEAVIASAKKYTGVLAYGGYPFLWLYQRSVFGPETADKTAWKCIADSKVPTLIIHGTQDRQVPIEEGAVISYREEIDRSGVCFYEADYGHDDILNHSDGTVNDQVMDAVTAFLKTALEEDKKR